jgi:uncharacterized membrane protein
MPGMVLAVIATLLAAWLLAREPKGREGTAVPWLLGGANLLLLFGTMAEFALYYYWRNTLDPSFPWEASRNSAWSAVMGLHGFTLVALGIWRRYPLLRKFGIGVLLVTVAKILIVDLVGLETVWRILVFIGMGVLLLLASYLYQRFVNPLPPKNENL